MWTFVYFNFIICSFIFNSSIKNFFLFYLLNYETPFQKKKTYTVLSLE